MIKKFLNKSGFYKNILTLSFSNVLAQAFPLIISPLLTRIYSQDDFGVFGLFMAITGIITIISTGRYELAIIIPKKDKDAFNIGVLSITLSLLVSTIFLVLIILFQDKIIKAFDNESLSDWLIYIPVAVFSLAVYQTLYFWFNRTSQYKKLSKGIIGNSFFTAGFNLAFGYAGLKPGGLIFSKLIGQIIAAGYFVFLVLKDKAKYYLSVSYLSIKQLAKKFQKFPKFLIIGHTLNVASLQFPVILLTYYFGVGVSGFFLLTQRVILTPTDVISRSVGDVFRQEAAELLSKNGNCSKLYEKTFVQLLLVGIIPFLILFITAPMLFGFIFGNEWIVSGEYARILAIMFYLQFVTKPLTNMFYLAEKQIVDLIWQFFLFLFTVLSFFIGYIIFDSEYTALLLFGLSRSFMYLVAIILGWNFSKGK